MAELHERYMDEPGPTDVLSFPLDDDDVDEDGVRCSATSSIAPAWRPRGTTRATPRPSCGCCSCTGSCTSSATTTRTTASAAGCGRGRSATAGCARRDLAGWVARRRARRSSGPCWPRPRPSITRTTRVRALALAGGGPAERRDAREDRVGPAAVPELGLPHGAVRRRTARRSSSRSSPSASSASIVGHARVVRVHAPVLRVRRGDGEDVRGPAHRPRRARALADRRGSSGASSRPDPRS